MGRGCAQRLSMQMLALLCMQVAGYSAAMLSCTERMMADVWMPQRGSVRNVYADLNQLSFDVAITALFGQDVASSEQVWLQPPVINTMALQDMPGVWRKAAQGSSVHKFFCQEQCILNP